MKTLIIFERGKINIIEKLSIYQLGLTHIVGPSTYNHYDLDSIFRFSLLIGDI